MDWSTLVTTYGPLGLGWVFFALERQETKELRGQILAMAQSGSAALVASTSAISEMRALITNWMQQHS